MWVGQMQEVVVSSQRMERPESASQERGRKFSVLGIRRDESTYFTYLQGTVSAGFGKRSTKSVNTQSGGRL
jgi:hypothetical protein